MGLSEEVNAPWTIYHDYDGTGWAGEIGKYGIVGAGAGSLYSVAQDIQKYSGKDRELALGYEFVSLGIGIGIDGMEIGSGESGLGY